MSFIEVTGQNCVRKHFGAHSALCISHQIVTVTFELSVAARTHLLSIGSSELHMQIVFEVNFTTSSNKEIKKCTVRISVMNALTLELVMYFAREPVGPYFSI